MNSEKMGYAALLFKKTSKATPGDSLRQKKDAEHTDIVTCTSVPQVKNEKHTRTWATSSHMRKERGQDYSQDKFSWPRSATMTWTSPANTGK